MHKILTGQLVEVWGDGCACKDYIYIEDLADAVVQLIAQDVENEVYNIGSGIGTTLNEIIATLGEVCGMSANVSYTPRHTQDVPEIILSCDKIKKRIGWESNTSLKEGVRLHFEWMNALRNA